MRTKKKTSPKVKRGNVGRLTTSLAAGQRQALLAIAKKNHTSIAFVVRYALADFINRHQDQQLSLSFPVVAP
jgi:hypothetical protein